MGNRLKAFFLLPIFWLSQWRKRHWLLLLLIVAIVWTMVEKIATAKSFRDTSYALYLALEEEKALSSRLGEQQLEMAHLVSPIRVATEAQVQLGMDLPKAVIEIQMGTLQQVESHE